MMSSTKSLENGHYSSPTRGSPFRSSPSNVNMKKANEELKRRINKLRSELESVKQRSKMVHKEKVQEVKAVRDQLEREKDRAVEQVSLKLLSEKHLELQRLRENLAKEKDQEVKQVLQYKEEELKQIHAKLLQQYEESVRQAQENTRKQVANQLHGATSDLEHRLMQEIKSLKESKERAEQLYQLKCKSDHDKAEDIRRMKSHYEAEIKRILQPVKDDKKEANNMQGIKRAMKLKDQEIAEKDNISKKLQRERDTLLAELQKYKDAEGAGNQLSRSSSGSNGPEALGSPTLSSTPKRALSADDTDGSVDNTTKKIYEEKEKSLLRKNSELQSHVQRLEKRVSALKTDNETLKKKQEQLESNHKPAEDKINKLKKRNAELATIARQLEEKAKALQQQNMRVKSKEGSPGLSQDIDHYKKVFARQRAKDLADHAQKVLTKDKEIDELKREVTKLKVSQPDPNVENSQLFTDRAQLESIVKQHAKEQLRLQRQISTGIGERLRQEARLLATGRPTYQGRERRPLASEPDLGKLQEYRALEETNQALQEELRNLSLVKEEKEKLEVELAQTKIECETLEKETEGRQRQCSTLASELQNVIQQNTSLTKKNTELHQEITQLDKLKEECHHLQEQVVDLATARQTLSNERDQLQSNVDKLESTVKHMQEAAEKRKQLEAEYQEALRSLQAKQDDVRQLQQAQEAAKRTHRQAVEQLETKVQSLERKCVEQTENFNQLSQELSSLRREATKRAGSPKVEIAIQTSPESLSDEGFGENGRGTPKTKEQLAKKQSGIVSASLAAEGVLGDESRGDEFNEGSWVGEVPIKKERRKPLEATKSIDTGFVEGDEEPLSFANDERERRRLLEEAGVVGLDDDLSFGADIRRLTTSDTEDDTFPIGQGDAASVKSEKSARSERSRSRSRSSKDVVENGKMDSGSDAEDLMEEISDKIDMNILRHAAAPKRDKLAVFIARYSYDPMQYSPNESPESELALNAGEYIYVYGDMDEDGFYEGELMDGRRGLVPSNFIERVADEDDVNTEDEDMPEFLQEPTDAASEDKPPIAITHADTDKATKRRSLLPPLPLSSSSQPHPVTAAASPPVQQPVVAPPTLAAAASDPASVVTVETEQTKEEAVVQSSQEAMIEELAAEIESTFSKDLNSDPDPSEDSQKQGEHLHDLEFDSSDEENAVLQHKLTYPNELQLRRGDHQISDLEDIPELEEENNTPATPNHKPVISEDSLTSISELEDLSHGEVACPKKLELERQMSNSIILLWVAPDTIAPHEIKEYRVFVDGQLKASVKGDAKTRALIDNVSASKSHRISVRTVTSAGQSEDAACTITVGKEATPSPSNLKAVNVLSTVADIMWLPGNSNLAHAISVNNVEVRTVKPSIYRYTLTGLSPMTVYRVNVRAKARRTSWDDNRNKKGMSAEIEFKTPPGGLPDPPLDLQVEEGPYEGSLLVTWLPVTITTSGTSNGAVVTGYAVCVDEKEIAAVDSPTADRLVVNTGMVKSSTYRYLTVRTLSTNGASADSRGLRVTMDLLRDKKTDSSNKDSKHHKHREHHRFKHRHRVGGGMYDNVSDETTSAPSTHTDEIVEIFRKETLSPISDPAIDDKLDQVPKDEIASAKKPEIRPSFREEINSDESSDRSELSDIAEEEELSEEEEEEDPPNTTSANNSLTQQQKQKEFKSSHELEFDTDPEIEQFNKQEQTVPIPVIRQQRDYERETEQSPDHHVQEPVPVKAQPMSVPHIEITKDSNSEGLGTGSSLSEHYGSDGEFDPARQRYVPSQMRDKKHYYPDQYENEYKRYEERKDTYGGSGGGVDQHRRKYEYRDTLSPNHARGLSDDDLVDEESMESEAPSELYDDSTIRYFVAMFTYDPATMSPNPDAYDEELPFREGQMIKVYGDKDADGFYRGEASGMTGYVPCNMVELARLSDKEAEQRWQKQTSLTTKSPRSASARTSSKDNSSYNDSLASMPSLPDESYHSTANGKPPMPADEPMVDGPPRKMLAIFDYDPRLSSPNVDADVELSFRTGDIITVYGDMDEDGFFMGELYGVRGLVPSNFLEDMPPSPLPNSHQNYPPYSSSEKTAPSLVTKNENSTKSNGKEAKTQDNGPQAKNLTPNTDSDNKKKTKGFFSKGKALFKKFGTSETSSAKQKR